MAWAGVGGLRIRQACPVEHLMLAATEKQNLDRERCHGLEPWSFHVAPDRAANSVSRHPMVAANVSHHGASPWHDEKRSPVF